MGKENISFLSFWIILGNIFATFSSDPEPPTSTVFGKTECVCLSACYFHESSAALMKGTLCGKQVN